MFTWKPATATEDISVDFSVNEKERQQSVSRSEEKRGKAMKVDREWRETYSSRGERGYQKLEWDLNMHRTSPSHAAGGVVPRNPP